MFLVRSDWHTQFDANRWILLPSTAELEDVRNFVQSVIAARKESVPAEIPDFYSKVSTRPGEDNISLMTRISVAFGDYDQVHIHTFTIYRA
jgi:hypothetical protein